MCPACAAFDYSICPLFLFQCLLTPTSALCIPLQQSLQAPDGYLKLLTNAAQQMMVLMLFPVKWPKSIKAFGVVLSWISLDFINFVSPSCIGTPLNYYWRFMLLVVGTATIIVVPWLFSYIRHKHWRPDPAKWEGAVKARFRDTYLLVTLFHPTVSGQAFWPATTRCATRLRRRCVRRLARTSVRRSTCRSWTAAWSGAAYW